MPEEGYKWDLFLSYRRWSEWPDWVEKHFYSLLELWLGEAIGRKPLIFFDRSSLESGSHLPQALRFDLARSRAQVALWSPMYFSSPWCRMELSLMLAREAQCKVLEDNAGRGLIVPVLIQNGVHSDLEDRNPLELQDCSQPRMTRDSPKGEELSDRIRAWAPDVARAIARAPLEWDARWAGLPIDGYSHLFGRERTAQSPPSLGTVV